MFRKAWRFICTEPGFYFATFLIIWLSAWVLNGLKLTAFDLQQLRDLFAFVMAKYVTDSGLNSELHKPIKGECK